MDFFRKWYIGLLIILIILLVGVVIGWILTTQSTLVPKEIVVVVTAIISGGAGYLVKFLLDREGLAFTHTNKLIEDKTLRLHDYIEKYYMPMLARARRLEIALKEANANKSPANIKIAFFRTIQWIGILKQWQTDIGGMVFFENLTSEKIILVLLNKIQTCFTAGPYMNIYDFFKMVEKADSNIPWATFENGLAEEQMKSIYENFEKWISDVNLCRRYLCCFSALVEWEVNNTQQPWYKENPPLPIFDANECDEIRNIVDAVETNKKKAKKYLSRIGVSQK